MKLIIIHLLIIHHETNKMETTNPKAILKELKTIRQFLLQKEKDFGNDLQILHPNYIESGKNFIHYLSLRTFKLKKLQQQLSNIGLSSIGSSEAYNLANIDNLIALLTAYNAKSIKRKKRLDKHPLSFFSSRKILDKNTIDLIGKPGKGLNTQVMITLPSDASTDETLILDLLNAGMNIARINCSHDGPEVWKAMIEKIKAARKDTGFDCKIHMDLGGPKLRTGPVEEIIKTKKKKKKTKIINYLLLHKGDILELYKKPILGKDAHEKNGKIIPAKISVTLPSIFNDVEIGQAILFDDGKIKGKIIDIKKDKLIIEIKRASDKGGKLKAEKGINLPDTKLSLPSLTKADLEHLPFVTKHADSLGFSFVNRVKDISKLQGHLKKLKREDIGIILKIETKEAFNNLPALILQAMQSPKIGIMTARGDLAIEIGWERISEVQEQILWLCEAAHIPNIWATQVLENLAKKGIATRAEITDAAMSVRAECVMLNKGPYILDAIETLTDILRRMQHHQQKRKASLRPLKVAKKFLETTK